MSEASETQTWLEFSYACDYIDKAMFGELNSRYEQKISMLNAMERKAETFCYR